MSAAHVYVVILAGGKGKRLWPLSRHSFPKQLIPFLNNKTLLDLTIERARMLVDTDHCGLVTVDEYLPLMRHLQHEFGFVINEPCQRNTAAAITLVATALYERDPQAVIFCMPADHYITHTDQFIEVAKRAISHALAHDDIVLLGIKPTQPITQYGYIEYKAMKETPYPFQVLRFHEKPSQKDAECYYLSPTMVWNSGMVGAKASVIMESARRYAPSMYDAVQRYRAYGHITDYALIPDFSFDTAVLEYAKNAVLFSIDCGWSDVGNLNAFLATASQSDARNIIEIGTNRNVIYRDIKDPKMMIIVDLDDVCVIEMNDIIFITKNHDDIRTHKVVGRLKEGGYDQYL